MSTTAERLEFPHDLDWVNTGHAPTFAQMRGRIALLYFWTFDSVNCLNILPDLTFLENKYHDGLCVIGVHSPKYASQRNSSNVLKAVNRHQLRHPVVSDPEFHLWQRFGIQAWPTIVLVDAEGQVAGMFVGEGRRSEIDRRIASLLEDAATRDIRVYEPFPAVARAEPRLPLAFPARVVATDQHLYIADTAHHRIIEANHEGRVLRHFGAGNAGYWDGRNIDCGFSSPHGLALLQDILYVADTGNHSIRRIRLLGGEVDTLAGTGKPGRDRPQDHSEPGVVNMCAPVDLAVNNEHLYISVAGQQQVWDLDLTRREIGILAGSGKFGIDDGEGAYAAFAQPAGLTLLGLSLIVADAGSGAIRSIRLSDGEVSTLVGRGPFEFGDVAGKKDEVRLQHPIGVCADPRGLVFISDSYNSKLKALNVRSGEVRAFNLPYRFHQPEGLAMSPGALWVANTNAHEIVRVDLASGVCKRIAVGE